MSSRQYRKGGLVDEEGKLRGHLTVIQGQQVVALLDERGKPQAALRVVAKAGEPGIPLRDANGEIRVHLAVDDEGVPLMGLFDATGRLIWGAP